MTDNLLTRTIAAIPNMVRDDMRFLKLVITHKWIFCIAWYLYLAYYCIHTLSIDGAATAMTETTKMALLQGEFVYIIFYWYFTRHTARDPSLDPSLFMFKERSARTASFFRINLIINTLLIAAFVTKYFII